MIVVCKGTENKITTQYTDHKKGFEKTHQAQVFFFIAGNQTKSGIHTYFDQGKLIPVTANSILVIQKLFMDGIARQIRVTKARAASMVFL